MKKLICFLIMVMAVVTFSFNSTTVASSVTNKGSTAVNLITMPTTGIIDMTAGTTDWFVQQNSSNSMMLPFAGAVLMSNSQNLWKYIRSNSTYSTQIDAKSTIVPISGSHLSAMKDEEVTKIPNMVMVLTSSNTNTQRSDNDMIQWRQSFEISLMNATSAVDLKEGTVVLKIWPNSANTMMLSFFTAFYLQPGNDNMSSFNSLDLAATT